MDDQNYDVAIIGGGISGIYGAWRLLRESLEQSVLADLVEKRGGKLRVGVFEVSNRIGGRLMSVRLPGLESTPVELGGMRFLQTHRRVFNLIKHLGLEYKDLPVADPNNATLAYLRGKHFLASDVGQLEFEPPYRLDRGERGRSPGSLLIEVALRHRRDGEPLRERGFWNLLLKEMSLESYQLLREAGGYDTIVRNWNAAEAIPFLLADFAPDARYLALKEGFETLPLTLADQVRNAGGEINLQHRLHRLDEDSDGQFRLIFDVAPSGPTYRFRRLEREQVYRAHYVILAMPRRSIEMLHPDSVPFRIDGFEENLQLVLPQEGFKIFAAYRRPWWLEQRGVQAGRSVTDLPVRQCYYWHTEKGKPSALMASYNDGDSVEFWSGLAREMPQYSPDPAVCPPGVPIPDQILQLSASGALVRELQAQLRELHALPDLPLDVPGSVPFPYAAISQNWTKDPFGGGWHFWKIGANAKAAGRYMRQPDPKKRLYVCGEAWSRQQGWVEGALETADALLEENLRIPSASWFQ
jgi:lysine 2-monooxygenase